MWIRRIISLLVSAVHDGGCGKCSLTLLLVDRKKELIKVKGLQVAPAELEAMLLENADVQDAAVIGVTINGEELPRAYIVPQTPEKATPETAESIKKWLAERVSKHKRLEGGVHFIDAVPKNPVSIEIEIEEAEHFANIEIVREDPQEAIERPGGVGEHKG
jgi:acyl-CoA synthetase (AMP-forming)/AMP-acid ligase II